MKGQIWFGQRYTGMFAIFLLLLALSPHTYAGPVAKRDIDSVLEGKDKRPFCNAFTGCGMKRSDPSLDTAASGAELDALAKHVLAEAKLWEQLQNKMEIMRTLAARLESRPNFRRKRSAEQDTPTSNTPAHSTPTHSKAEEGKQE